jgi:flagellar assembly protein FliH
MGQGSEPFIWFPLEPAAIPPARRPELHDPADQAIRPDTPPPSTVAGPPIEQDAFANGYAEGERAGAESASARADAMLRRLAQTIDELEALRNDVLHGAERHVVQLAMAIAQRMLQRELTLDRGLLLAMARVALDRLGEQTTATIRLHPDDHVAIMAVPDCTWACAHVHVVADPFVDRGGCLVQTDFGLMDAGLDGQFQELARALLGDPEMGRSVPSSQDLHGVAVRS